MFYNNVEKNIPKNQLSQIVSEMLEFQQLLKNKKHQKLSNFIEQLEAQVVKIERKVQERQKIQNEVVLLIKSIIKDRRKDFEYLNEIQKKLAPFFNSTDKFSKSFGLYLQH